MTVTTLVTNTTGGGSVSGQPVALVSGTIVIAQISGQAVEVGQTLSGQALYVQISGIWKVIANGSVLANGGEQIILDNFDDGECWGYVRLDSMQAGDIVTLRQYIYANGAPSLYRTRQYNDVQANPLIAVRPRPVTDGVRFTIQQTAGTFRTFNYNWNTDLVSRLP